MTPSTILSATPADSPSRTRRALLPVLLASAALLLAACGGEETPVGDAAEGLADAGQADAGQAAEMPHPGQAPYEAKCAACHDKAVYKAPSRTFLAMLGARNVYNAMDQGLMRAQSASLSDEQKVAVAEYLTGQTLADSDNVAQAPRCEDSPFDEMVVPISLGWGVDAGQTRFQGSESGGIDRGNVADLEVKWSFAFPNAIQARSQPAYGGGAVYFGSQDGTVRSLDAKTGCVRWTFQAGGEVRNAIVLSPWDAGELETTPTLYFGDIVGRVYALDARTGALRWSEKVTEHPDGTLTGAAALHDGILYVPLSSLEVVSAVNPAYECCSFRGAVVALNAATGEEIWRTHTIPEPPSDAGVTRAGTTILAPSGAPVWNSPAIDVARGQFYVGTGENYSSPADGNSDAIIAFDLKTGEKRWVSQQTEGDAWNAACLSDYTSDDSNCPEEDGPDYDFGASPMLVTLDDGRDIVIGGQKSGQVVGLDPDTGEVLWKNQVGRGGVQGGIHFGMAAEGSRLYIPISDMIYPEDAERYGDARPPKPGLYAVDAATGDLLWSAPAEDLCGDLVGCDPGISHAIKAIPGAVIAGYLDGRLRVHDGETGAVLWELNTLEAFETVSGEVAHGGSFSGGGAIVADGMVYLNSGYGLYGHMPGNVFLALGPRDETVVDSGP